MLSSRKGHYQKDAKLLSLPNKVFKQAVFESAYTKSNQNKQYIPQTRGEPYGCTCIFFCDVAVDAGNSARHPQSLHIQNTGQAEHTFKNENKRNRRVKSYRRYLQMHSLER